MRDLPLELWLRIAEYLPKNQICKLLPINRRLFHAAMDWIYREFEYPIAHRRVFQINAQLQYPSIGNRVQKLHLDLGIKPIYYKVNMPRNSKDLEHSVQVFAHMKNLREVSLEVDPWLSLDKFVPLLKALARELSGRTLERFSVSVPLMDMKYVFPLFTRPFSLIPCMRPAGITIKELYITLPESTLDLYRNRGYTYKKIPKIFKNSLFPFLTEHGYALETLSVTSLGKDYFPSRYFVELVRLLRIVPSLHLSKLAIHGSWIYNPNQPNNDWIATVTEFINSQKASLTHFTSKTTAQNSLEWLQHLRVAVNLPNLRVFDLDLQREFFSDSEPAKTYFAVPSQHSITSLILDTTFYPPKELHDLIEEIRKAIPGLLQLSIAVMYLLPQTLDVTSSNLPSLETLRLKIASYGACWPIGSPAIEMENESEERFFPIDRIYRNWKLKELGVFKVCPACREIYPFEHLLDLLRDCIPSVEVMDKSDLRTCFPKL